MKTVDSTVLAASRAAPDWASSPARQRADLLAGLARALEEGREPLVKLAHDETGLGALRLSAELDRTAFQLRRFADEVTAGAAFSVIDDPAASGAPPAGHPHLHRVRVPVGPVAMFSASNFPFAFSVLGGDTASALAAGCPVVVKSHPGHTGLSREVHELALRVLRAQLLPAVLLGLVEGASPQIGQDLARHPAIRAVAFTGSLRAGLALQQVCRQRVDPIPFYGELGSINPVVVLPCAMLGREQAVATALAQSIALGTGQFCTSPGVIIAKRSDSLDLFVRLLEKALASQSLHPMLNEAIRTGFDAGCQRLGQRPRVAQILRGASAAANVPAAALFRTDAASFCSDPALREEVFGPEAIVVEARDDQDMLDAVRAIKGSLTATIWGADEDNQFHRALVRAASSVAGRVLFSGVPTGVAVSTAQHHGGPFPASTQPFSTSVGSRAIDRFLRPVVFQDPPDWLLSRGGLPV
ncbi:aldehyde dehydrogenase (NADP(+)) [Thiomonas sp. FB-Cd]|uniref:aldehyde dehydrogenase (NADP(+)) n=1 Tax=Thiomonas sp. FB-Cd TaxID=1158292 RepID=UPI0004DEDF45